MNAWAPERTGRYRPTVPRRIPRSIPDEWFNTLFAALPSNRDRAMIAFWISSGVRASELIGVRQRDVDPGQQLITVVRKGSRARQQVPASADAFVWLRLYQQELMPILEQVMRTGSPLVVIAENVDGPALGMLVTNAAHGTFRSLAVRAPGFGFRRIAELEDMAALTGGRVITGTAGRTLEGVTLDDLGRAEKVIATERSTAVLGGAGGDERVVERIENLKIELERATNEHDQDKLGERIAKLSGGVAVIRVGAASGVELKEKQMRLEDSLAATRAAAEEGVVAGGGAALLHARAEIAALDGPETAGGDGDAAVGRAIVAKALAEPLRWIAINAGLDPDEAEAKVAALPVGSGLDALRGDYADLHRRGILDPVKVTRSALLSAASIAALLLTTETLIVEEIIGNPGSIHSPEIGDLAEGLARPSNIP
ncbi:TCP-1/cpn60 chaperonin family protein [Streptomyces sp. NPDC047009]|uniref:TCP-1/cpn60 chaperonin family protein n=1 Tax=unclassified Streptomyces TaxID=2593676 RepID=UPI0033C13AA8